MKTNIRSKCFKVHFEFSVYVIYFNAYTYHIQVPTRHLTSGNNGITPRNPDDTSTWNV
jgi:hypothetical protein